MIKPLIKKLCIACNIDKPLSDFDKRTGSSDGHRNTCKQCRKSGNKKDYNSPTKRCSQCQEVKPNDSDHFHSYTGKKSKTRTICKECHYKNMREVNYQAKYSISSADYDTMFKKQSGCCAICQEETKLFVDHCHTTNKVRGLLCDKCNRGIGMFDEDLDSLEKAIEYIKNSRRCTH